MSQDERVFFTAGHGLYNFHIDSYTFDRNLYYNLLLQPALVAPEHFFLQGHYIIEHLGGRRSKDTWLEIALRKKFVIPFFRSNVDTFGEALVHYRETGLKGFTPEADQAADYLDTVITPEVRKERWNSTGNSMRFRKKFEAIFRGPPPIMPEHGEVYCADYYAKFWADSEEWRNQDIKTAKKRAKKAGALPISVLLQATADRLFGEKKVDVRDVRHLIEKMADQESLKKLVPDVKIFYLLACEYYNRTLADSLLAASNTPRWSPYISALDFNTSSNKHSAESNPRGKQFPKTTISLPAIKVLQKCSGDVLASIRETDAFDRYCEALLAWKRDGLETQCERLTAELLVYANVIRKKVGEAVGHKATSENFEPRFLPKLSGIVDFLDKVPDFVLVGLCCTDAPAVVKTASFGIFCLKKVIARPSAAETVEVTADSDYPGVHIWPDVTILGGSDTLEEDTGQEKPPTGD